MHEWFRAVGCSTPAAGFVPFCGTVFSASLTYLLMSFVTWFYGPLGSSQCSPVGCDWEPLLHQSSQHPLLLFRLPPRRMGSSSSGRRVQRRGQNGRRGVCLISLFYFVGPALVLSGNYASSYRVLRFSIEMQALQLCCSKAKSAPTQAVKRGQIKRVVPARMVVKKNVQQHSQYTVFEFRCVSLSALYLS